ncbi:LacI family transcriptional regulator [Paenibacillus oralis]|uniref:LacI family transcriptional regulator n=1 Tax=Paenibacillus oralis TaxID=2490856 RepID=A0A3P3U6H9_9BACL|nr:LacI family DNA-binding transcriptional regulator [Paenibacillus oralis]RRJ65169.1 LacI family transcriptional regulator [Paenibacillus oralis]
MNVSIYDVAKLAGVSISTVSRVINKSGYVSSKTEAKVNKAMETLQFVPSITAQNLAKHQTMLIGLYFNQLLNSLNGYMSTYVTEFIRGVNKVIMEKGYHLLLINELNEDKALLSGASLPQYTTFLKQKRIDGLLFGNAPLKNSSFFELVKNEAPMVYIGEKLVSDRGLNVYAQFKRNVLDSLDYLFERNHRDIAILSLAETEVSSIVTEYKEMRRDERLKIDIRITDRDLDPYMEVLSDLFSKETSPTALVIMDFGKVQPTINYLNNKGMRVPEDVSIMTQEHHFEDGEQCFPAVTSVYVPIYQMAVEAAQLLLEYLEGKEEYNKQILVSPQLIERQSVAFRSVGK